MALGFGPAGNSLSWSVFSIISLLLTFSTSILLISALFKFKGPEFRRCLVMFFFLSGSIVFALAIGWGRAPWVPFFGMPIRYVMLALPALIIYYFSWFLYGSQTLKQLIPTGLFLIMFVLISRNAKRAYFWRDWYQQGATAVINDIRKGVTFSEFITRHQSFLLRWNKEKLPAGVLQLKKANIGPFKFIKDDVLINKNIAPVKSDSTLLK